MRGLPRQVQLHRPALNGVATCNMQALPSAEALWSGLSFLIWAYSRRALMIAGAAKARAAYQLLAFLIFSKASFTRIKRFSANFTASAGTPRAIIKSGWLSRTSACHLAFILGKASS